MKSKLLLSVSVLLLVLCVFCACGGNSPEFEQNNNTAGDAPPLPLPDDDGSAVVGGSDGSVTDGTQGSEVLPPDGSKDEGSEIVPNPNAGITLSHTSLSLLVGQSARIDAAVVPVFSTDSTAAVFSVSDDSVASVDRAGNVLAKAEGRVQICVQSGDLVAYCALTVTDDRNANPGIILQTDALRIFKGKSQAIEAVFVPARQSDDKTLLYTSSDPAVATVDKNGNVTAHSAGIATLTVANTNGQYQKTLKITVPHSFSFLAAGDNLLHSGIYNDAKERAGGGGYDFLPIYAAIADKVAKADFAMINQEGVFTGDGLSSYPKLNGPQEGIKALADLGFDIISLANNHCLDKGGTGLAKSMTYLDTLKGVIRLGGYFKKNNDALKTRVIEKDGIKVALLAYTTFTNEFNSSEYAASGVYVPWVEPYSNTIDDLKRAKTKADAVLVFMHWGDEEKFAVTDRQREIAKVLAEGGADVIVGAHPHVIQPVEYIEASDGRQVPCIYSLGTLVSNMMTEQNMLSCLATFDFAKDPESGKITVENIEMDPYVFYYNMNYRQSALYRITDLTDELASSHGIGNYPKDSSVKNTMSISRLYGYLRDNIDPAFLPQEIKKELG